MRFLQHPSIFSAIPHSPRAFIGRLASQNPSPSLRFHTSYAQSSDPPPFLLLLCKTLSPQPAPPTHLRRASHTTLMPSTASIAAPVGALENRGRISPSTHRFSNCPHSHSHDLENSHLPKTRAPTLFRPHSHFSYLTYGYYCLLFIYIHTYPPLPSRHIAHLAHIKSSGVAPSFRCIMAKQCDRPPRPLAASGETLVLKGHDFSRAVKPQVLARL